MREILLLTPQLPYPPQQGTSLRNLNILRALAQHHRVTLLSFAEPGSPPALGYLASLCTVLPPVEVPARAGRDRLQQLLTTGEPDVSLRLRSEPFANALSDALRRFAFDAVQIEGIELARYIDVVRRDAPQTRIVLDCHNAETELQRRALRADVGKPSRWPAALFSALQVGRLERFEKWAMRAADAILTVSANDRDHLPRLGDNEKRAFVVIPNTIDVDEYTWPNEIPPSERFDLVFTGKMDYRPNIDGVLWFADEIWPRVLAQRPGATWAIVGQRPHPRLERLREAPGVTLTGRVLQVQPFLAGCQVYVVPLRIGSGTRLKLIEAMATGCAIVSTGVGAEGLPVAQGDNILLADEPAAFAAAILSLLDDPGRRETMGQAARAFATRYDWRTITPLLDDLYTTLIPEG